MIYINEKDNCVSITDEIYFSDKRISYRISFDLNNKKILIRRAKFVEAKNENYQDERKAKYEDFEVVKPKEHESSLKI